MVIVSKKRLSLIIILVFVSIASFSIKINNDNSTVTTSSLPVTNKIIILDAGHRKTR